MHVRGSKSFKFVRLYVISTMYLTSLLLLLYSINNVLLVCLFPSTIFYHHLPAALVFDCS